MDDVSYYEIKSIYAEEGEKIPEDKKPKYDEVRCPEGKVFDGWGWHTAPFSPLEKFKIDEPIMFPDELKLYAMYKPRILTIKFTVEGESLPDACNKTRTYGAKLGDGSDFPAVDISSPHPQIKKALEEGRLSLGWFYNGAEFDPNMDVKEDITLDLAFNEAPNKSTPQTPTIPDPIQPVVEPPKDKDKGKVVEGDDSTPFIPAQEEEIEEEPVILLDDDDTPFAEDSEDKVDVPAVEEGTADDDGIPLTTTLPKTGDKAGTLSALTGVVAFISVVGLVILRKFKKSA